MDAAKIREFILDQPGLILNDAQIMAALFGLPADAGDNIVDLNARAAAAMAAHLARLDIAAQDTTQTAYANHMAAQTIHRAILHLLDAADWATFTAALGAPLADLLDVTATRLIIETDQPSHWPRLPHPAEVLIDVPSGFCDAYIGDQPANLVHLRQITRGLPEVYGPMATQIQSEAILDLGPAASGERVLFTLASDDAGQFQPSYGTDMLAFFAAALQRIIARVTA
jgi:uncharacterized protein YigA (DUF484 family)